MLVALTAAAQDKKSETLKRKYRKSFRNTTRSILTLRSASWSIDSI